MEYNIEKLSEFIYDKEEYQRLVDQIYYLMDYLSSDYPKHYEWYFQKHLPFVGDGEREILFIRNHGNVCGIAFLKKTKEEKKICTFYVAEHARNKGIGRTLMTEALNFLETETPMITMPTNKVEFFLHFIYKYNWKISQIKDDYYIKGSDEIVFNGWLD